MQVDAASYAMHLIILRAPKSCKQPVKENMQNIEHSLQFTAPLKLKVLGIFQQVYISGLPLCSRFLIYVSKAPFTKRITDDNKVIIGDVASAAVRSSVRFCLLLEHSAGGTIAMRIM